LNGDTRTGFVKKTTASKDTLLYTIRGNEKFFADADGFSEYPFEKSDFSFRFEIPAVVGTIGAGEKAKFFFDYYPTKSDDVIKWKGGEDSVDNLPEHHIDFHNT